MVEETRANFILPTPKRIDRYDILGKIAEGGMAEIFLAKQSGMEGFEKLVVLKCILPALFDDAEFIDMFLDEARIAAKLNHPNIIQIYDLGRTEDTFYIAMEHVSGRNMQQLIFKEWANKKYVPIHHICKILAGVSEGLHYAHEKTDIDGTPLNIVHRDVSPQNIIISFDGNIKLVDFGIAKAAGQVSQTRTGVLKGKYAYMSPEHVRGEALDGRSDIFSVGVLFYEMLTGKRPFEQDMGGDTLRAILTKRPADPRRHNPDIPRGVMRILAKCLEKKPQSRYQNAQELQIDLEDYLTTLESKSSSVRLARYMNALFEDELSREDARLHVSGVGDVVLPAGALEYAENSAEGESRSAPPDYAGEEATGQFEISQDLFSEVSRTEINPNVLGAEDSELESENQDFDTMTAFDARAYQEYVAKKHKGEDVDEPPVFISQEAAAIISEQDFDEILEAPTDASKIIFGDSKAPRMAKEEFPLQEASLLNEEDENSVTVPSRSVAAADTAVEGQEMQTHDALLNTAPQTGEQHISHRISSIVLAVLVVVAGLTVFVLQQWTQSPFEANKEIVVYAQVRVQSQPAGASLLINGVAQKKQTPLTVMVPRVQSQELILRKDGFEDKIVKLQMGAQEPYRTLKIDLIPQK